MSRSIPAALAATALVACSALPAAAETMAWKIRSTHAYKVYIKFHSQDYNRVWPAATRSWTLEDSRYHTFRLDCARGELVCYGATTRSRRVYWGVGLDGDKPCRNCCSRCNGTTRTITLN